MRALAIAAHPDDIEFMMAGTLILLKKAGVDTHIMNISNGCYGSEIYSKEETARIRTLEAQTAAKLIGAEWYPSITDDANIFYTAEQLRKVAAVIRKVQPDILLTLSRYDYMEDHEYTSRLASSAAFNRCLPAYITDPPYPSFNKPIALYHSLPHSLMDMQRTPIIPEFLIDISSVIDRKSDMLSCHKSQKDWLDATQGMGSYLEMMKQTAKEVAQKWTEFEYAEGWRRHNHVGYGPADFSPLQDILRSHYQTL